MYCDASSNPIPLGWQKFNHGQYGISFLQSMPSLRDIVPGIKGGVPASFAYT